MCSTFYVLFVNNKTCVNSLPCLQDKIVSLSDANATLDAAAHEAKAAQNRTQAEKVTANWVLLSCACSCNLCGARH